MTELLKKYDRAIENCNKRMAKELYAVGYSVMEISEKLDVDPIEVYNSITKGRKFTTIKEREEILELRSKGYSISLISKIMHRSRACIRERIKSSAKCTCYSNKFTDEQVIEMNEMDTRDKSIATIAKELNVKSNNVRFRLQHTKTKRKIKHRITKTEIEHFIELWELGYTVPKIAKETGRCANSVRNYLKIIGYFPTK